MAYNITLTNGQNLVTVADGTTDTNFTSLTLIGKNFAGYGQFLNENFVNMLENFSNNSAPPNALQGQTWWDSTNKLLKVYTGAVWKTVSSSTSSASQPATPIVGDLWWDTSNGQLKVWSGSQWVVIGPAYTANQGQTGAVADIVPQSDNAQSHIVVKFFVNNTVVAVLSKDASFAVSVLPGFTTINPGFNLATLNPNALGYYGDANNALNLGGVPAANYLRGDQTSVTEFPLTINNNTGLTVGTSPDFNIGVTNSAVNLLGLTQGKDLSMYVNVGGISTKLLSLNATNGSILLAADPTVPLGAATKQYVDNQLAGGTVLLRNGSNAITGTILPASNGIYNFGSASATFNNIYANAFEGTASNALALGGAPAANYARTDITPVFTSNVSVSSNGGITIGAGFDFTINSTASPNAVNLIGNTLGKNLNVTVNVGGTPTTAIAIDGATGLATVLGDPVSNLGIATKQYVLANAGGGGNLGAITANIVPSTNNIYNIGTNSLKWNTVYATTFNGNSSTANYADLAERFAADQPYSPGTVVELGGIAEITAAASDLSENVFGVISTNAAYLMNAGAGDDYSHPPIAMQGRVPVRVTGTVNKGDRLVSAGNGLARAALRSEISPYNVIGRALSSKSSAGEGTVEAIVKLNS